MGVRRFAVKIDCNFIYQYQIVYENENVVEKQRFCQKHNFVFYTHGPLGHVGLDIFVALQPQASNPLTKWKRRHIKLGRKSIDIKAVNRLTKINIKG